jgi:putative oxidoreductase
MSEDDQGRHEADDYHREVYGWDDDDPDDRPEAHSRGLDFGLLALRLGSLLLLPHGFNKLVDMPAFTGTVADNLVGGTAPELIAWLVALGQVGLPVLLTVGLFTRPAAFLLAALMAGIWALAVVTRFDYTLLTEAGGLTGEAALLYVALALPLAFTGAGRWSLDSMRTDGRP